MLQPIKTEVTFSKTQV